MKKFNKKVLLSVAILFTVGFLGTLVVFAAGPATVNLGTAGDFAILTKSGITNVPTSVITGDVGASPITGASIGLTCAEVAGSIYATDGAGPLPCSLVEPILLSAAVSDMEAAYTDAATRTPAVGANLNIGGGTVSTQTLAPGLYTWTTPVSITGDITLSGGAADIWIFQVTGSLSIDANKSILLAGGALPKNIFWQTTETVNLMEGSHFEGNILSQTDIAMRSGATLSGRALAQTEVTLIANTITIPTDPAPVILPGTLHVIKTVINNDGGNKTASDFTINVTGTSVSNSSFTGEEDPGTTITLDAGAYSVDEDEDSDYTKSLSADCSGTIASGEEKTCTITNNDKEIQSSPSSGGGSSSGGTIYGCKDPNATNYNYFSSSRPSMCIYSSSTPTTTVVVSEKTEIQSTIIPKLPKTGFPVQKINNWYTNIINNIWNFIK
jgi:hypothetical protein